MAQNHPADVTSVDWPARFRAAAEAVAELRQFSTASFLRSDAEELEHLPPHVVEAIGRALLGEGSA